MASRQRVPLLCMRAFRSLFGEVSTSDLKTFTTFQSHAANGIVSQETRKALLRQHVRLRCTRQAYSTSAAGEATTSNTSGRGPVSYLSLGLTLGTGFGLLYYYRYLQESKLKQAVAKTETAGRADIGGPFELVDQNGKPFTEEGLKGRFSVLYFGFTHCPDICPDELEKLAEAINTIEKRTGYKVQPIFITLDPERDSVAQVRSYVREFHPRLIGLTGPMEKVKEAARAYRVYFSKTQDSPDDYLVDHSIIMYLIDPEGQFVTFYGKNFTAEQLAANMWEKVVAWNVSHPEPLPASK